MRRISLSRLARTVFPVLCLSLPLTALAQLASFEFDNDLRSEDGSIEGEFLFEREPTEGETWPLGDDQIDLTPVVRELALLSLPLVPLCRDDCEGPDVERFPTGPAEEPDEDAPPARDERWAALDALTFDE